MQSVKSSDYLNIFAYFYGGVVWYFSMFDLGYTGMYKRNLLGIMSSHTLTHLIFCAFASFWVLTYDIFQ